MIKNAIFDIGGVLGPNSNAWDTTFSEIKDATGLSGEQINEIFDKHWPEAVLGKISILDFWEDVYEKSPNDIEPGTLENIYANNINIDEDVLDIAKQLKRKDVRIAIVTNMAKEWLGLRIDKFGLGKLFEKIYCSCEVKIAKPNKGIYEHIRDDMKIDPQETVFIDNLQKNTDAAAKLGFKSILFKDVDQLKLDLTSLGVNFE